MTLIQAVILGLVQGITEFIPISSSAHLAIIPFLFNWPQQPISFDIALHLGSLIALLIFFRKKLKKIFTGIFSKDTNTSKSSRRLTLLLIISTIPVALLTLTAKDLIVSLSTNPITISLSLIVVGIVLVYDKYIFKYSGEISKMSLKSAFFIGVFQSLALIRGVSRSGITIIGGGLFKLSRPQAVEFAFLAGIIPLSAGTIVLISDLLETEVIIQFPLFIVGFLVSLVTSYFIIDFLIRFVTNNSFRIFGIYRIILGIIIFLIYFLR